MRDFTNQNGPIKPNLKIERKIMSQTCHTQSESCSDNSAKACAEAVRICGAPKEACPVECAAESWKDSFMTAMEEVQVDILKEKIKEKHGPMLEEAADGMMEAMCAYWQSLMAEIKSKEAQGEFKEKLYSLWTS